VTGLAAETMLYRHARCRHSSTAAIALMTHR
jgi:hypothetical protein